MNTTKKKPVPDRREQRVVGRLLAAVDKSIEAADQARKARDELVKLTSTPPDGDKEATNETPH